MDQKQRAFVAELAKLHPAATFLTVKGYRNEHSEVADYSIIFNMSYKNAVEKSLGIMKMYMPLDNNELSAKTQLMDSFENSLRKMETTPMEELEPHYAWFLNEEGKHIKGVKLHIKTQVIHLYGLVAHKKVIVPGSYPSDTRMELTIVKNRLRRLCPVSKFRQFRIVASQVDSIHVQKLALLPPE